MTTLRDAFDVICRQRVDEVAVRVSAATGMYPSLAGLVAEYTCDRVAAVLDMLTKTHIAITTRCWSLHGVYVINCGLGRWVNNCEFYISGGNIHYRITFRPDAAPTDEEILSDVNVKWRELAGRMLAAVGKKCMEACDPGVGCTSCF